jgi:DNA invertase Pin-like site-specific DNA recombinase
MEYMQHYGGYPDAAGIDFRDGFEDSDFERSHANENGACQTKNLTETERHAIYQALLEKSVNGRLKRNTTTRVVEMLHVSKYQVRRVWQRVKECRAQGRRWMLDQRGLRIAAAKKIQVDLSEVLRLPLHRRTTIRSVAAALGVPKSTLHRRFKEGQLRRHSNTLKPLLKEANKKERLRWCICMLDPQTLPNKPKFIEMDNIIHLDEHGTTSQKRTGSTICSQERRNHTGLCKI